MQCTVHSNHRRNKTNEKPLHSTSNAGSVDPRTFVDVRVHNFKQKNYNYFVYAEIRTNTILNALNDKC